MSIDIQADLTNVERAREIDEDYLQNERKAVYAGGARYRNPITTEQSDAGENLGADTHSCLNCGADVTAAYARVNADNDGNLWHCGNCVTQSDMKNGAGAMPDFQARCPDTGGANYGNF